MAEIVDARLNATFGILPEALIAAHQRVPYDNDNFIPLGIFNIPFSKAEPTLVSLGGGAVTMSLMHRPFGFMQYVNEGLVKTQQTDKIILAPDPSERRAWLATLTTEFPLTEDDFKLFSGGIEMYVSYVEGAMLYEASRRPAL